MPKLLALFAVVAMALVLAGCEQRKTGVALRWESPGSVATVGAADSSVSAAPLQTTVYISNQTGQVLRGAKLRLPDTTQMILAGLAVGTVTSASTEFEGRARVWSVGDIEPGGRLAFPLALWFSSPNPTSGTESLELTIELASQDLATPVESNRVTFTLSH